MSGFINLDNYNGAPFELFQDLNVNGNKFKNLTGTFSGSRVSNLYFSQSNVDLIQNQLISGVYKQSFGKYKISKQSEDELLIIMRSIYLQYSKNNDNDVESQVIELNRHVLDYSITNVLSALQQQDKYIDDITKDIQVNEMPQFVHSKGDKTLMPNHFF